MIVSFPPIGQSATDQFDGGFVKGAFVRALDGEHFTVLPFNSERMGISEPLSRKSHRLLH